MSYNAKDIKDILCEYNFSYVLEETRVNVSPFSVWAHNETRRKIYTVLLDPSYVGDHENDPTIRNIWMGYQAKRLESVDTAEIQPILDHLFNIICNKDEQKMHFLVHWLAHVAQNPKVKTNTAPVLTGEEGTGKSILFDWMLKHVIGLDHGIAYDSMERLSSKFNALAEGKTFAIVNEASNYGGCIKSNNIIKNIITNPTLTIEKKHINSAQSDDHQNFVILTNEKWPIRVTRRSRRPFVCTPSEELIGNDGYFSKLGAHIGRQEAKDNWLTFLLTKEFTCSCGYSSHPERGNYINIHHAPETAERRLMASYLQSSDDYFLECLFRGETDLIEKGEEATLPNETLHQAYIICHETGRYHGKPADPQVFGRRLTEAVKKIGDCGGRPIAEVVKNIGPKKARGWKIRAILNGPLTGGEDEEERLF